TTLKVAKLVNVIPLENHLQNLVLYLAFANISFAGFLFTFFTLHTKYPRIQPAKDIKTILISWVLLATVSTVLLAPFLIISPDTLLLIVPVLFLGLLCFFSLGLAGLLLARKLPFPAVPNRRSFAWSCLLGVLLIIPKLLLELAAICVSELVFLEIESGTDVEESSLSDLLLAGPIEETIFRMFLLTLFYRLWPVLGVVLSSGLFGFLHLGNLPFKLVVSFSGLILAYAYLRGGWPACVVLHSGWNSVMFLLYHLLGK
ncbi:MAG: hypothetical protein DRO11_05770, partial [Methanobacteriota archaeon]